MIKNILLILMILASIPAFAVTGSGGIVYGKDNAYTLTAPSGWVLDNKIVAKTGVHAAFYPKGRSWDNSPAIMYSRVVGKKGKALDQVIADDVAAFKNRFKDGSIIDQPSLKTNDGKTIVIKNFIGDKSNSFETVAYIDEQKTVTLIVLSSKTKDDFDKSAESFKDLVKSYFFFSDKVIQ